MMIDVELTKGQYETLMRRTEPKDSRPGYMHELRTVLEKARKLSSNHRYAVQMTPEMVEGAGYILRVTAVDGGARLMNSRKFDAEYVHRGRPYGEYLLDALGAGRDLRETLSNRPVQYEPDNAFPEKPWRLHEPDLEQWFRLPCAEVSVLPASLEAEPAPDQIETPERFDERLYGSLPDDYSQAERPFAVTIAGPERHNGEAPYTYVVTECSTEKAWAKALAWHMVENERVDCFVVAAESFEGTPADKGHTYHWTDLRPEHERQRKLDDLADRAQEFTSRFVAAIAEYRTPDGDIAEECYPAYDDTRATFGADALELVESLGQLNGRDGS
jgi:hypothetical protein